MVKALDCTSDEYLRAGSIPDTRNFFFNDEGGASRSSTSERKARALKRVQRTKPKGAKRLRMRMQSTKLEGGKRPIMRVRSTKPEGGK